MQMIDIVYVLDEIFWVCITQIIVFNWGNQKYSFGSSQLRRFKGASGKIISSANERFSFVYL